MNFDRVTTQTFCNLGGPSSDILIVTKTSQIFAGHDTAFWPTIKRFRTLSI